MDNTKTETIQAFRRKLLVSPSRYRRNQSGFTLVELILIVEIVFFLALIISNLPTALTSITASKHTSIAREIANKQIEHLRKLAYLNLTDTSAPEAFSDSSLSTLPQATAVYEITPCAPPACSNSEPVKKVTVTVSWNHSGTAKSIVMGTLVGQGGIGQ